MKFPTFIIITLLFFSNSFAKMLDQVIVIIEDDVITQSEFQDKLKFIINQYRISGNPLPNDRSSFRQQILDGMINIRLQVNYAKQFGLNIEEWMIDKAMENMAKRSGVSLTEFREKIISEGVDSVSYTHLTLPTILLV